MAQQVEIGIAELKRLIQNGWKLILGLGVLCGAAVFAVVGWLRPASYQAEARLLVYPLGSAGSEVGPTTLYGSLLESERVIERASEILVADGVLPEGARLRLGRDLKLSVEVPARGEAGSSVISLTAWAASPQAAVAKANAWARVFLEESQDVRLSTAANEKQLLEEQLAPTRQQLSDLEAQRALILREYQDREEKLTSTWDQRVAAAEKKAETAVAEFETETRRLMEEFADRRLPDEVVNDGVRTKLLDVVSVRAQLAQTPRIMNLQKSASDETLAELLVRGGGASSRFDATLTSQEVNPLYEQLVLSALALESEMKLIAGPHLGEVSKALADLERIQLERAVGWVALRTDGSLEQRTLRRGERFELQELARERMTVLAEYDRRLDQIRNLESQLSTRLNAAVVSGQLDKVEVVKLVAPAVASPVAQPRRVRIKVATASFLGAMLGLMITLFQSTDPSPVKP